MPRTKASLLMILATAATVTTLLLLPFTPKTPVHTALVQSGDWFNVMRLEGVVSYRRQQNCVNLYPGTVSGVYVHTGQQVHAGDLLFRLDTSAQESLLAQLSGSRHNLQGAEWLAAFGNAAQSEWELRSQIEAGKIRAQTDGLVSAVYVETGDQLAAAGLLGVVGSSEKCVTAIARAQELQSLQPGTAAVLTLTGGETAAVLEKIGAPAADETTTQVMQPLTFASDGLAGASVGEKAGVQLLMDHQENVALIPISAVDSQNQVWVVADGKASPVVIDVSCRNEQYVACDVQMAGKRLVLQPEAYALWSGCPVKEAASR